MEWRSKYKKENSVKKIMEGERSGVENKKKRTKIGIQGENSIEKETNGSGGKRVNTMIMM